jgi:hypothetical protein
MNSKQTVSHTSFMFVDEPICFPANSEFQQCSADTKKKGHPFGVTLEQQKLGLNKIPNLFSRKN